MQKHIIVISYHEWYTKQEIFSIIGCTKQSGPPSDGVYPSYNARYIGISHTHGPGYSAYTCVPPPQFFCISTTPTTTYSRQCMDMTAPGIVFVATAGPQRSRHLLLIVELNQILTRYYTRYQVPGTLRTLCSCTAV